MARRETKVVNWNSRCSNCLHPMTMHEYQAGCLQTNGLKDMCTCPLTPFDMMGDGDYGEDDDNAV